MLASIHRWVWWLVGVNVVKCLSDLRIAVNNGCYPGSCCEQDPDIDRLAVFDVVSDAGLLAVGTLMKRLGLEGLLDETVRMGGRVGGSRPGRYCPWWFHAVGR